jgi:hypothetical protein
MSVFAELWRLKIKSLRMLATAMEAWRNKMEPWRLCRHFVADSHHFDEKQDLYPNSASK